MSDRAALGALFRSQACGLKVPGDLSIVGCSDDATGLAVEPALTTIHLPAEELAQAGIREIDRLVNLASAETAHKEVIPVRLVTRAFHRAGGQSKKV